jgi:hypothetical protein
MLHIIGWIQGPQKVHGCIWHGCNSDENNPYFRMSNIIYKCQTLYIKIKNFILLYIFIYLKIIYKIK